VLTYEDIFRCADSAFLAVLKMRIIQELIQIERPRNWSINSIKKIALEIISIEKYNSRKSISRWLRMEEAININFH
jgi:hypothetical protein